MGFHHQRTDKTHAPDGSKTMSQLAREHDDWRDQQPTVTRCSVHLCDWTHEGAAVEGRAAFLEHRGSAHPTADRAARGLDKMRRGGAARAEAAAEQRREQITLRAVPAPDPEDGPATAEETVRGRSWSRRKVDPDEALAAMRARTAELGRPPHAAEWQQNGWSPSTNTYRRLFGSWAAAVAAALSEREPLAREEAVSADPPPALATAAAAEPVTRESRGTVTAEAASRSENAVALEPLDEVIVAAAINARQDEQLEWIERLEREAMRARVRAGALDQIAHGLRVLRDVEAAA